MNRENKDSKKVVIHKKYILINAKDEIKPTIIGTLASIISKSNDIEDNTYVLSLAQKENNTTKVSLRISGIDKKDIR